MTTQSVEEMRAQHRADGETLTKSADLLAAARRAHTLLVNLEVDAGEYYRETAWLAAAIEAAEAEGWRTIDSAPRDGTAFLALWRGEIIIAAWRDVWAKGNSELVGLRPPPLDPNGMRMVDSLSAKIDGVVLIEGPTMWRPLPAAPGGTDGNT